MGAAGPCEPSGSARVWRSESHKITASPSASAAGLLVPSRASPLACGGARAAASPRSSTVSSLSPRYRPINARSSRRHAKSTQKAPCPRFDSQCGAADALGSAAGEPPAPEAGLWYDYQVLQLAENAALNYGAEGSLLEDGIVGYSIDDFPPSPPQPPAP